MSPPPPTAESSVTYVVELTPPGRAAVAVVLVSGPDAGRAVANCFTAASGRSIVDVRLNRIVVGRWGGPSGEELIACRRAEEEVEIHSHGGAAAVRAVVDALVAEGCVEIKWQDWLRCPRGRVSERRESASRRDATTWAAQIALADVVTARTAAILLDQFNGALSAAIDEVIAAIATADWPRAAKVVGELLERRELGLHLTTPWRVVFAGPPNVGKSSLINALAGYERAIVSPTPGTTRDVVTLTTAIDGWPVQLADTAGLRATQDDLESAGVALAEAALANADLAILVRDTASPAKQDEQCSSNLPSRVIHVRNKIDLVDASERRVLIHGEIVTSALTGEGIADLAAAIAKSLVPTAPASGSAVPFTADQIEKLVVVRYAIQRRHAPAANDALQSLLAASQ